MNKFLYVSALLFLLGSFSLLVPETTVAQTMSCQTGDGKDGVSTDGGPCVPTVPTATGCDPSEGPCQPGTTAPGGTTNISTGDTSGFVPLAPIPGLTASRDGGALSVIDSKSLADFFNNLYLYIIGLAAAAAVIQIIYAGIELALNQGSVSGLIESKGRISRSIQGIILIFSPVLVFSLINPTILNLDLNLQPLDTKSRAGTGTTGDPSNQPPPSGCSELTGTFLQKVTCATEATAQDWVASCKQQGGIGLLTSKTGGGCGGTYVIGANGEPVCKNPIPAQVRATCSKYSSFKHLFVSVGSSWSLYTTLASIKNETYSQFQTFKSTCSRDGGRTCVADPGEQTFFLPNEVPCPTSLEYQSEAWFGSAIGKCYSLNLLCAYNDNSTIPTSQPEAAPITYCATGQAF